MSGRNHSYAWTIYTGVARNLSVPRLQKAGGDSIVVMWLTPTAFRMGHLHFVVECSAEPTVLAGRNDSPDYVFKPTWVWRLSCLEKARLWDSKFLFLSTSRVYPIALLEAHPWREEEHALRGKTTITNGITSRGVTVGKWIYSRCALVVRVYQIGG